MLFRTLPIPSTSRNGLIFPARSLTRTAGLSRTLPTCRSISARWIARSSRSSSRIAGKSAPGDVFALNAPYNGGTHLPDITVVTPVFDRAGERVIFYVASRGHHADVGGTAPGSMTPNALSVEDEGVLIDNFRLVSEGQFQEEQLERLLSEHRWPCRNPHQNIADLKAQIAANEMGIRELNRMVDRYGLDVVHAYMGHVQDNAEESVRRVIGALHDCSWELTTDQGSIIRVRISVDRERREATVDFTGTSPQQETNFNAPEPVTRAAVLYVFRLMVNRDIPMNAGCLRPVRIVIPDGCMLKPRYPASGRRRKRGDLPARHQCASRGTWGAGEFPKGQ